MDNDTEVYLTRRETAERAGVTATTVDRWARSGQLRKHIAPQGLHAYATYYLASEVDALIALRSTPRPAQDNAPAAV